MSVQEGVRGIGTRVGAVVLVGIGLAAVTLLGLRRREPTVTPPPPGEEEMIVQPPSTVIRQFSQSVQSGQVILTVGFVIDPRDPRSSIKWDFGDGSPEVLDQLVVNHNYDRVGVFNGFVEVIDSNGVSDRINFSVSASAPTPPPVGQQDIISNFFQDESVIVAGGEVGFSIALAAQTQSIIWDFGDGSNRVLNVTSVDHTYTREGTFEGFVEAIDLNGNAERIPFTVLVQPSPFEIQASIQIGPQPGAILEPGEVIPFRAILGSGVPPFVNLEWDFGDGIKIQGPDTFVSHIYRNTGNFMVTMTVTDSAGNTATATKGIFIQSAPLGFGDVVVTIEPLQADFDWRVRLQNLRTDLTIFGDSIIRIADAPGFGSRVYLSRRRGFTLDPGQTESDLVVNPSDLPVNRPLLFIAEFQEQATQRLLGDATEQFSVPAPEQPTPLVCEVGFHEENGVCVPDEILPPVVNGPEPPPPAGTVVREEDFRTANLRVTIPQFQTTRTIAVQFRLPANVIRSQFARVFVKLRIDFTSGAEAKIFFNNQQLDEIKFFLGESNQFKQRDIVVTGIVLLNNQLNDLVLEFSAANIFFPAEALIELASVFVRWEEPT